MVSTPSFLLFTDDMAKGMQDVGSENSKTLNPKPSLSYVYLNPQPLFAKITPNVQPVFAKSDRCSASLIGPVFSQFSLNRAGVQPLFAMGFGGRRVWALGFRI